MPRFDRSASMDSSSAVLRASLSGAVATATAFAGGWPGLPGQAAGMSCEATEPLRLQRVGVAKAAALATVGLSDTQQLGDASNRRPGRVQGDRLVAKLHAGLRIGSKGGIQRLGETWLELTDGFEAGAELRMHCGP